MLALAWLSACVLAPLASETAETPSIPASTETAEGTAGEYCATRRMGDGCRALPHYPGLPLRVCPVRRLRVPQPIPTTWRLAVAYQLSGPGGRLPTVRQVRQAQ